MSTAHPTLRRRRPKRWILPAVVVLVWLAVGGPLGTFAGKLSTLQENDNAAFLPENAESTVALEKYTEFSGQETVPATVVFEREGGLTREDRRVIEDYVADVKQVEHVDDAGVIGPVEADSGEAAQVVVPLDTSDGEVLQETVGQLRDVVADPPEGLTALVGGQGGVLGDFIDAFGAIDGVLLAVALGVVLVILLVVYRTIVLPLVVMTCTVLGLGVASAAVYALADADVLDINGQSQGILFVLAVGAATDYSLLIIARFREELRDHESKYTAIRKAHRAAIEPILASGATVILGLLCLLLSDLSSLRGLGPVGSFGIAAAMFSSLTLLPAALALLGRKAFWPFEPRFGSEHRDTTGIWGRVSRLVGRRARAVWLSTFAALAVAAAFVPTLNEDPVPQTDVFLTEVESVEAQEVLDRHFDADRSSPAVMIVPLDDVAKVTEIVTAQEGVVDEGVFPVTEGQPGPQARPKIIDGQVALNVTLEDPADSVAAMDTVRELRQEVHMVSGDVVVGGQTAIQIDTRDTTDADRAKVIPSILVVIFLVLALLLRALLAPFLLLVANVLSFGATLGISAVLFNHVFDFPAADPATSLIGFVFLVALGIDYSIFLMTRVREEALRQGTHPGILKGLSVTGGVITSAGVVLAATFAALGLIPILFLAQIGFIVAFGVLLDTFVVRSLLVPALSYDIGPAVWWPSRLRHTPDHADASTAAMLRRDPDPASTSGATAVDKSGTSARA